MTIPTSIRTHKLCQLLAKNSGFTLIAMLIVIVISVILAVVSRPMYESMIRSNRLAAQANLFISAMNLARSEAVKRIANVSVTSTSGDHLWTSGWTVVVDSTTIREYEALNGGSTLVAKTASDDENYSDPFIYDGEGFLSVDEKYLELCSDAGAKGRKIIVSPTGHVRVTDFTCSEEDEA